MSKFKFPSDDLRRSQKEHRLQVATADYLKGEIHRGRSVYNVPVPFPLLKYYHPASEGRSAAEGAKFKRKGVTAGLTDWLLWGPNKWHGLIELKVDKNGLSASQKEVRRWALEYGFAHAVCYSVQGFRDQIIAWGHQCKNHACIEPDYITDSEKKQILFDMYAPR